MAIYSVNQVNHVYVANKLATSKVTPSSDKGSIRPVVQDGTLYFEYRGATNLMRTDLIKVGNIKYACATKASDLSKKLKSATVTLDANVNSGNPVAGQDYIVNILIRQYIGMSDRDTTVKFGVARAFKNMTASQLYVKLAKSLALNFSREVEPLLKFYVKASSGETEVTASTDLSTLTGTYTGVVIKEVEQEWVLGVKPQEPVYFEVQLPTIEMEGDDVVWGNVTKAEFGNIINGKEIADLEYFSMGDRGDIYRNIGWPKVMNTQYLVDPTKPYDVINIHYFYEGGNEQPHKSEKDITIVVPNADGASTVTDSIITAINTATGLEIKKLGTGA